MHSTVVELANSVGFSSSVDNKDKQPYTRLPSNSSSKDHKTEKPIKPVKVTPKWNPSVIPAFRKLITLTDGRDKAMKFVQYSGKILLWLWLHDKKKYPTLAPRVAALVSGFSTTRKVIRLAHVVEPASDFADYALGRNHPPATAAPFKDKLLYRLGYLASFVGIFNDLADDVFCLAKLGALDKSLAAPADMWASRMWLMGIMIDIHATAHELAAAHEKVQRGERLLRKEKLLLGAKSFDAPNAELLDETQQEVNKLLEKRFWLRIQLAKLFLDGIFCGWDVFHLKGSDGWQACSGWASGALAGYKVWCKLLASC